jgi:hypothetical protein
MVLNFINPIVGALSYEWFTNKSELFKKEPGYNFEKNVIEVVINNPPDHDESTEASTHQASFKFPFFFKDYCWDADFPGCTEQLTGRSIAPVRDSKGVLSSLITGLTIEMDLVYDNLSKHRLLSKAEREVDDAIFQLTEINDDAEYYEILMDFSNRFHKSISEQFWEVKRIYEYTADVNEKLEFDLNQDELACFVFLLMKAGIVHNPDIGRKSIIDFCSRHFYFWNQKKHIHTEALDLQKKLSDAKQEQLQTAMGNVKNKLSAALRR